MGDHLADRRIAVRRDGADLGDLVVGRDLLRARLDVLHRFGDGEIDAALEVHRVHAGGDGLGAFADDRLGEHGGRGGAVSGDVARLGRDLADHLGAHVLELVGKLDLLGDGDAVLGDAGCAVGLLQHHVPALRAEGHPYGIGENVDAAQHLLARIRRKPNFLGGHGFVLLSVQRGGQKTRHAAFFFLATVSSITPMMSDFLHDQQVVAVDAHLGAGPLAEQHAIAGLHVERLELAVLVASARTDGDDLAFLRLLLGGVRNDDAAL